MNPEIKFTKLSDTVDVHLSDGRILTGPRGSTIEALLSVVKEEYIEKGTPIVGAVMNTELRELTYPVMMESRVEPLTMKDEDGMRIYRRSLTFLLSMAFEKVFPEYDLAIDHSVSAGGYYCQVKPDHTFTKYELGKLESEMRRYVEEDVPFVRVQIPLNEVNEEFAARGYDDKVRLLSHRKKGYLMVYQIGDYYDYHHGYMVPSTGYIRCFGFGEISGGFTLRFPRRRDPMGLSDLNEYPKMLRTFRRYGDLLERLDISSVGSLNKAIEEERFGEIVLVSEAMHAQRLAEIEAQIADEVDRVRVILIAGPTSSGKTTTSKRLAIQLLARGISPFPIAMDHYFVDREFTPKDEKGEYDFESIKALNRERLASDLNKLIAGEEVQIPHFDFYKGKSEEGEVIQVAKDQIIILEGIHGLNPMLIPGFPAENTFRIYISALTQLNLDRYNRVSTTDTRMIRRIVRDARERGYDAQTTIQRWESVTRGEKRNIFPYQENADVMFNSALVYELSVLKPLAEPLLRQVHYGRKEYIEAKRLLSLLEWFLPGDEDYVPDNSLLQEFIGSSSLKGFTAWNHQKD